METNYQQLAEELTIWPTPPASVEDLMSVIVGRLQERLRHFDWVGFYMIEKGVPGEDPVLVLGPYVGADTPHKRIPLNQGICGAAASSGQTVVVDDVKPIRVTWRVPSKPVGNCRAHDREGRGRGRARH